MKETFTQTSFRLGGFDLSPSLSPAKAASGRPKLVSDAKSPRSVVERGLLYAACKLQLRECPAYTLLYQFSPKDTGQSKVK